METNLHHDPQRSNYLAGRYSCSWRTNPEAGLQSTASCDQLRAGSCDDVYINVVWTSRDLLEVRGELSACWRCWAGRSAQYRRHGLSNTALSSNEKINSGTFDGALWSPSLRSSFITPPLKDVGVGVGGWSADTERDICMMFLSRCVTVWKSQKGRSPVSDRVLSIYLSRQAGGANEWTVTRQTSGVSQALKHQIEKNWVLT